MLWIAVLPAVRLHAGRTVRLSRLPLRSRRRKHLARSQTAILSAEFAEAR